ncbi:MAG: sulfotransferase domain-containing protein [Chlamydiales bacterium]|nr:sulfotransferase domain-containing protein [Chlamydiales bacterium]
MLNCRYFRYAFFVFAVIHPLLSFAIQNRSLIDPLTRLQLFQTLSLYNKDQEDVTFLLSEIHSGNTWCRYCIESLTKRPTMQSTDLRLANLPIGFTYQDLHTDLFASMIWKCHDPSYMNRVYKMLNKNFNATKDKLILLLRNYKECSYKRWKLPNRIQGELFDKDCAYFSNIYLYDKWPEHNRLLIYYEDLMLNPKPVLIQLVQFLGQAHPDIDEFLEKLEFHQERSIRLFEQNFGKSESTKDNSLTQSLIYHQKKLPPSFWQEVDDWIIEHHPSLVEKYLQSYINN